MQRKPWFALGLLLLVGVVATMIVQVVVLKTHSNYWIIGGAMAVGVIFMLLGLASKRGVVRTAATGLAAILTAGFWYMVLAGSKLPTYDGPAAVGNEIPAFEAKLADGTPFTKADLTGGGPSVLVFFRGKF